MLLKFKDTIKVIKAFIITTAIFLTLVIVIFLLTDSFPFGSLSSDSYLIFWPFVFLSVLFGLIAGTYKYNKLKKENGIEEELSDEEKFKIQVENYENLSLTKSNRGKASLFLGVVILISIAFGIFDVTPIGDVLYSLIIYIPLVFFIYKGHRWAMYSGIVLWTLEKGYQIFSLNVDGREFIVILLWWLWFVILLYSAIKVENERERKKKEC